MENQHTKQKNSNLTKKEENLLELLRNRFRWGDVTIVMRDGQPISVKRVTEINSLNT